MCTKQGRPQQHAALKDTLLTVSILHAATGDPVMNAIFFADKTMQEQWRLRFDPFADWFGEENEIHLNIGWVLTALSMVKMCHVSAFFGEWEYLTGTLLVQMLQAINSLKVFDCTTCLNPFLLLDGHGSHFESDFLEYINTVEHKLNCCIGLSYGILYWLVGDSSEQNGSFKMFLTKVKQPLVLQKSDTGIEYTVNRQLWFSMKGMERQF